jgi:thiamine-monophosphate kinase
MKVSELGEFELIERLRLSQKLDLDGLVGIGDDCAVIPKDESRSILVTTDLMVEDIHFLKAKIKPEELGHKLLAVNLSDIAAMGGIATYAFLSMSLPNDTEVEWLDRFFQGFYQLAEQFQVRLLGGDTTGSSEKITFNLTLLGEAENRKIKFRSRARLGDLICVTGNLGNSAAGLQILLDKIDTSTTASQELLNSHHKPRPHVLEGQWLAARTEVHAMMDLSDGLYSDIQQIMRLSQLGARIELGQLPISQALATVAAENDWSVHDFALLGGEDYGLLLTVSPESFESLATDYSLRFSSPVHVVGEMVTTGLFLFLNGQTYQPQKAAFNHFKERSK